MPSLKEVSGLDLAKFGYVPVEPISGAVGTPPSINQQPGYSPFMRCPLPPIATVNPDSLRQFYTNGVVPQTRMLNPNPIPTGTGTTIVSSSSTSVSSSSSTTTTTTIKAVQASITTSALTPNAKFVKSLAMSQSFQLLNVSCTGAARVELYGTTVAQSNDLGRGLDVPPPAGTAQNIITDLALDTAPYSWTFQDRVGANGDLPQTNIVYITVTNLGIATTAITVTLTYGPIVNG